MTQAQRTHLSRSSFKSQVSLVGRIALCTALPVLGFGGCYFDKFTKVDGEEGTGGRPVSSTGGRDSSSGGTDAGGEGGMGGEIVSDVALANADEETTSQGEEILLDLLANDSGPGISFVSADDTDPSRPPEMDAAQFSVSSRGVLTFEPTPEFWGTYRASYVIEDENGEQSTGSISIHVIPESISLSGIEAGHGGFVVDGAAEDFLGVSVSAAGDVNGDGIDDFLIGAPGMLSAPTASDTVGRVALVLGSTTFSDLDLAQDNPDRVQMFVGADTSERHRAGISVSRAGRVNDDALDDIIIGAADEAEAGAAYVLFGTQDFPGPDVILSDAPSDTVGFTITGTDARTGAVVSGGFDMDGAGNDDVLAYSADGGDVYIDFDTTSGASADVGDLVFSSASNVPAAVMVGDLFDGDDRAEVLTASFTQIFLIRGGDTWPANGAGITQGVNGWKRNTTIPGDLDNLPQLTGAGHFDGNATLDIAYCEPDDTCRVVPTTEDPDDYDLSAGWDIAGFTANVPSVSGGGDLNSDGLDDLVFAEGTGAYVVWGQTTLPTSELDVTDLGSDGFSIDPNGNTLGRVSIIGDINDDGVDDYAIAVPSFDTDKGRVYVLFGARTTVSN